MGFSLRRQVVVAVVASLTWGWAVGTRAAPKDAATLTVAEIASLQKKLQERDTLAVDFTQERYLGLRKITRKSSGHALFAKPGRFRWAIDAPKKEEWIYDGSSLFLYKPVEKQATRYPAGAGESKQLQEVVGAVMDFGELLKRYEVAEARRVKDDVELTLKPKTALAIQAIEIHVVERENRIGFVKLLMGDDYNAITFSAPKAEVPRPDSFAPPKGVKVKDM